MIQPSQILQTRENEAQYERWKKQRAAAQKSYQVNASPSPNYRPSSSNTKPTLKKQSSFLIERNKSFVDLDNLSDNDAGGKAGGYNPRLTKQKSSSGLLNERGIGSALGLAQGFRGSALAQKEPQKSFNFGKPNFSQFHHSKSGGLALSRSQQVFGKAENHSDDDEGSQLNDDNITNELVDQEDDSWDEKIKAQI